MAAEQSFVEVAIAGVEYHSIAVLDGGRAVLDYQGGTERHAGHDAIQRILESMNVLDGVRPDRKDGDFDVANPHLLLLELSVVHSDMLVPRSPGNLIMIR